jgi:hypothetical protein
MAANGISDLPTKEARQQAKLELAALDRERVGNPRAAYEIEQLPTQYSGDDIVDNANTGGLIEGRPWVTGNMSFANILLEDGTDLLQEDGISHLFTE